jgi:hypothetical protein
MATVLFKNCKALPEGFRQLPSIRFLRKTQPTIWFLSGLKNYQKKRAVQFLKQKSQFGSVFNWYKITKLCL